MGQRRAPRPTIRPFRFRPRGCRNSSWPPSPAPARARSTKHSAECAWPRPISHDRVAQPVRLDVPDLVRPQRPWRFSGPLLMALVMAVFAMGLHLGASTAAQGNAAEHPRPKCFAPRAMGLSISSKTTAPAPSPSTMPVRSRSKRTSKPRDGSCTFGRQLLHVAWRGPSSSGESAFRSAPPSMASARPPAMI